MDTIDNAEVDEDAIITNIGSLRKLAIHKLIEDGRRIWPDNPFDALKQKPQTYIGWNKRRLRPRVDICRW